MTRVIVAVFIILVSFSSYGYRPTPSGLFSHAFNDELAGKSYEMAILVEQINLDENEEGVESNRLSPFYAKLLFQLEDKDNIRLIETFYSSGEMKDNSLITSRYIPNFIRPTTFNADSFAKRLFYRYLASSLFQRGEQIISLLNSKGINISSSNQLINNEKRLLLEKYKRYLIEVNRREKIEDKALLHDLPAIKSPLEGESEEEVLKIKEIMASSFYVDGPDLYFAKGAEGKYFWEVKLDGFFSRFTNENHFLTELGMSVEAMEYHYRFYDYKKIGGIVTLPSKIVIEEGKSIFSVRILGFKAQYHDSKRIKKTWNELKTKMQDPTVITRAATFRFPSFL